MGTIDPRVRSKTNSNFAPHLSLFTNLPALEKEITDGLSKLVDDAQQHVALLTALTWDSKSW